MCEDVLLEFLHLELVRHFEDLHGKSSKDVSELENVGFNVGTRFIEKYVRDWSRFKDELEIIKFICKEFWSTIFGKQADALRTNHQGIYVLTDDNFRFIQKFADCPEHMNDIAKYLAFPCGIIRGALSNFKIDSVVTVELQKIPSVRFQIQVPQANC